MLSGVMGEGIGAYQGRAGASFKGKLDVEGMYGYSFMDGATHHLLTDKSQYNYFELKVTKWLFRKEVTPDIGINVGILGALNLADFNDYLYLDEAGATHEYDMYHGASIGTEASVNFTLSPKWCFQPSMLMWLEGGRDFDTSGGTQHQGWYKATVSSINLSLIRTLENGNRFYISVIQNFWDYSPYASPLTYELDFGYIFAK
jgi:hypothetical protein